MAEDYRKVIQRTFLGENPTISMIIIFFKSERNILIESRNDKVYNEILFYISYTKYNY